MKQLITNVLIVDGSGDPARGGEVLIANGSIAAVSYRRGGIGAASAPVFNGQGMALAPGFIDAHGHSDMSLLASPGAIGKISQGITSEIAGNCGLSPFPVTDMNRDHLEALWRSYNEKISWSDYAGYRRELLRRSPAINLYSQCGHNTLRAAVAGYEKEELSAAELDGMRRLLLRELQSGAVGFSTGLLYTPGVFSTGGELVALLRVLAPFLRVYTTHLRSEGNRLIESVAESVRLCREAGQRYLHLSHLKTAGAANHHKIDELLELLRREGGDGALSISADRYPYVESLTQLSVALPSPYDKMDDVSLMDFLQDEDNFQTVVEALRTQGEERLHRIRLVSTGYLPFKRYIGLKFLDISNICMNSASYIVAELLRRDAPGAMAAFCGMSVENLRRILRLPFVACGTDESARPQSFEFGVSHPRGFGSMPRFIRMLTDEAFSFEEAVARVTSLPARIFNLSNRGRIAADMAADLVLLDPDRFYSDANFSQPHELASGVAAVWVNGKIKYQPDAGKGVS
ncbi:MAG: amidohydrolase family protein [Victivallaceae bacterium]|nr:amidohydrolase family protein [Victivallaceae bacterium]